MVHSGPQPYSWTICYELGSTVGINRHESKQIMFNLISCEKALLLGCTCDSVRFRDEAGQTFADWITVPVGRARGSGSAGRRVARIWLLHALLVLANIAVVTVGVHHALRAATGDGIRLRDEASQAATDGITVPVGGARGARSARGRVAGVTDFASNFGCGVRDQTFRTLAGRLSLVGDAH